MAAQLRGFRDGVNMAVTTLSGSYSATPLTPFRLGDEINAEVDELRIYRTLLTDDEIRIASTPDIVDVADFAESLPYPQGL